MKKPTLNNIYEDDQNAMIASPAHKEIRLNSQGGSRKIDLKGAGSKKQEGSIEKKTTRENFYDFYKQIQKLNIQSHFNNMKKHLLVQIDRILTPVELCQEFDRLYQRGFSMNVRTAKKTWTEEEQWFLVSLVIYYSYLQEEDISEISQDGWKQIADMYPDKKKEVIKFKWQSYLKVAVSKAPWSPTEDALLVQILKERGNKRQWKEIANELNLRGKSEFFRHGKQCRERWINHLDPSVNRGVWTVEEDVKLLEGFIQLGKKWAEIAKVIGQRTENSVKNRWGSIMRKCKNEFGTESLKSGGEEEDYEGGAERKLALLALQILTGGNEVEMKKVTPEFVAAKVGGKQTSEMQEDAEGDIELMSQQSNATSQYSRKKKARAVINSCSLGPDSLSQNLHLNREINEPVLRDNSPSSNVEAFLQKWQKIQDVSGPAQSQALELFDLGSNFTEKCEALNHAFASLNSNNFSGNPSQNTSKQLLLKTTSNPAPIKRIKSKFPQNKATSMNAIPASLGIISETHWEDRSESSGRNTRTQLNSLTDTGSITVKERSIEEFTESLVGNHNLQFAVVDFSSGELRFLTKVTKENFRPYITGMKSQEEPAVSFNQDNSLELCDLSLTSPTNTNISSLNRDLANLAITPRPGLIKETDDTFAPGTFEDIIGFYRQSQ